MKAEVLGTGMNRRKFLKISAVTAGVSIIGGGTIYTMFKDSVPLSPLPKEIIPPIFEKIKKAIVVIPTADVAGILIFFDTLIIKIVQNITTSPN